MLAITNKEPVTAEGTIGQKEITQYEWNELVVIVNLVTILSILLPGLIQ